MQEVLQQFGNFWRGDILKKCFRTGKTKKWTYKLLINLWLFRQSHKKSTLTSVDFFRLSPGLVSYYIHILHQFNTFFLVFIVSVNGDYLDHIGLTEKVIHTTKEVYIDCTEGVIQGSFSKPFKSNPGVHQGCILSPIMGNEISNKTFMQPKRGIQWRFNEILENLDYSIDTCLLSHKAKDVQEKWMDSNKKCV